MAAVTRRRKVLTDDTLVQLLVLALQALLELLVPQSLGLVTREILLALCLTGALWLLNRLREVDWSPALIGARRLLSSQAA